MLVDSKRKGKSLVTKGGNDRIYTPLYLCERIVKHFKPAGKILEPCSGIGNFLKYLPNADWYEIDKGKDFLLSNIDKHYDWVITNPPYSLYRAFFNKCMDISDNIVFLQLINATFYKARLRDMIEHGFSIYEIAMVETPKEFPQFGFQMGCVHYKKGNYNSIKVTIKM